MKVAELNTLSDGNELEAYLVRCFNETEITNENTNLHELADVKEALPSGT